MTAGGDAQGREAGPALPVWAREHPRRRPRQPDDDGVTGESRRRSPLSRGAIVAAAVAIADAEGLEAVSIRRVAGDLGARPMSLYTYIERKEDLLALMRDQVNGEVLLGAELPAGWRNALAAIARRTREVALRHPWMVETAAHGAALGPNALRHLEESLAAVAELGLGLPAAAEVLFAVDKYVLGHVALEVADVTQAAERAAARPYLESLLATGEFPRLSRLAADGHITNDAQLQPAIGRQFEQGLTWLLDGIAADVQSAAGTS